MNKAKLLSLVTEKWPVKVLSIAAALLISIFYRMSNLEIRSFSVPLVIEASETLIPVNSFTSSVRISLRGSAGGIHQILDEDIEAYIDLGKLTNEGNYKAPVHIRKKGSALGVDLLEISVVPIEIPLLLEKKVTKTIPVFQVLKGTVAEGYELTYHEIFPANVVAEGPRSYFEHHFEFYTEIINLDGRYDDFSLMVNIVNDNPLITIFGSKMLEFRGTIQRIYRGRYDSTYRPAIINPNTVINTDTNTGSGEDE